GTPPRALGGAKRSAALRLSGLEPLELRPGGPFVVVGERTNVTGSPRFSALVKKRDWAGAVAVARQQVENGANLIDVNFDEALLDGVESMRTFLRLVASEPSIARVPVMLDSSRFEVIEAGPACAQGKGVGNPL